MTELPERVRKEIEDVRAGRSSVLDLSFSYFWAIESLEEIPEEIFELSGLEKLYLSRNSIRIVPERIRDLPNLKQLYLQGNPIEAVPDVSGLGLDWETYLRCGNSLSADHLLALDISLGEDQRQLRAVPEASRLLPELRRFSGLCTLEVGLTQLFWRTNRFPRRRRRSSLSLRQWVNLVS